MHRRRVLAPTSWRWSRGSARLLAALLVGWLAFIGQPAPAVAQAAGDLEAAFAARVTAERRGVGRGALPADQDLVAVARAHSAELASSNRLYHNTLLGKQVQAWQLVAENIGMGSSVEQVHEALMASPGHRANIIDARFTGIGIGVVQVNGSMWVTQVFRQGTEVFRQGTGAVPPAPPPPPTAPVTAPAPAAPAPSPPPPAPKPRPQPAAVPTTTATVTATTTTQPPPPTTSPPPPAETTVQGSRRELGVLASSSVPLPTREGVVGPGLLAATLLSTVAAGLLRVTSAAADARSFGRIRRIAINAERT